MTRRDDRKSRAASRNARRAAENIQTAATLVSPEEARRQAIRSARIAKTEAERRNARRLNAALTEPPPDATVTAIQAQAEAQRTLAAKLDEKAKLAGRPGIQARKDRRGYLDQAKLHDRAAADGRERQLENWRRFMTQQEIEVTAKARGDELVDHTTEVADWIRDETTGAVVRDKRRLPTLKVDAAVARRRKSGLEWLFDKKRIDRVQYAAGQRLGQILADVAKAAIPGRGDETGMGSTTGQGKPSGGPADWKIEAVAAEAKARDAVFRALGQVEGAKMWRLLTDVCLEGKTVRAIACGDDWETLRCEERLKIGLAVVRHGLLVRARAEEAETV